MGTWRMRPPWVQQSALDCWAASTSSWSRVTPGVPDWNIAQVKSVFNANGFILADGTLDTIPAFRWFVGEYNLKWQEIVLSGSPEPSVPFVRATDLSYEHFNSKLKLSHVLTVMAPAPPMMFAHVVVVYGADKSALCRMDPLESPPDYKQRKPCEKYFDFGSGAPKYLTIWRKP